MTAGDSPDEFGTERFYLSWWRVGALVILAVVLVGMLFA